jgi:hypothetical protein
MTQDARSSKPDIPVEATDRSLISLSRFLDLLFALAFFAGVEFLPSYTDGHLQCAATVIVGVPTAEHKPLRYPPNDACGRIEDLVFRWASDLPRS